MIRFKFVEGTGIRLGPDQAFYSSTGTLSGPQQAELDAINALQDMPRERTFELSDTALLALRDKAEQASGVQMPDLTLWYHGLVGGAFVEPASSKADTCSAMSARLEWLNGLSIIETAQPVWRTVPAYFNAPSPSVDISPTTTTALEPPHMMPFPGVDSPLVHPWLSAQFNPGWRGEGVGVVDVEHRLPNFTHEKVNVFLFPGGEFIGPEGDAAHALASISVTFGTAFSGNVETNPRYGTRGFAPNAARGFSRAASTCFLGFTCMNVGNAILRAAPSLVPGDIIYLEVVEANGSLVGPNGSLPVEINDSAYDAIRTVASTGVVIAEAAGNGGAFVDPYINDEPDVSV